MRTRDLRPFVRAIARAQQRLLRAQEAVECGAVQPRARTVRRTVSRVALAAVVSR